MVVRFVRDHDAVALAVVFAEMQDARVFAGPDHDVRSGRGQRLEVMPARLIAAMLAPLRVEGMQLDDARFAPELLARFASARRRAGRATREAVRQPSFTPGGTCCCSAASAWMTAERALACISSVRPYSTVSSSAEELGDLHRQTMRRDVAVEHRCGRRRIQHLAQAAVFVDGHEEQARERRFELLHELQHVSGRASPGSRYDARSAVRAAPSAVTTSFVRAIRSL